MRIVKTIPHPKMRIVLYSLDAYYYIEFEGGPMKQGYKVRKESIRDMDNLVEMIESSFADKVVTQFDQMFPLLKELSSK